ncbi:hypothetical protein [Fluviicola sp.]|uniref:hypothetical protein n=1 Tax=Fluviicola sp. TaxID=1917219 RepID=UPI0031D45BAF
MEKQTLLKKKSFLAVSFVMVFLWFSYTNPVINRNADKGPEIASIQKEKSHGTTDSFPIDYIIRNSRVRANQYHLSNINYRKLKPVGSTFFQKWFDQMHVNISVYEQTTIYSSSSNTYYFFDHKNLDSVFLFTLFEHLPEYDVYRLYHFTVDKRLHQIVSSDWIAAQGGKEGYTVNEQLSFSPSGNRLRVHSTVYKRHNFYKYTNTIQTTFRFGRKKTFRKMVITH